MTPESFRYAEADGIATITLDRPERLNALTFEVYAELRDLFDRLAHHDPVRGFGPLPKAKPAPTPQATAVSRRPGMTDAPPPGTPKEFLGMPVIPPRANRPARPPVDPEKLAKLKQKMREQGMLPDEE